MDEITSTPVGRKAKAILNRLLTGKQVTEDGLRWLVQSTDPFHDTEITPSGFPDANPSRSVVRCIRKQAVLRKPGTLAAGPWDARIDAVPLFVNNPVISTLYTTAGVSPGIPAGGFVPLYLPVCVTSGPVGSSLHLLGSGQVTDNRWSLAGNQFVGRDRLVGIGIEVHNVTSELTKCGTVSCWRMGQGRERIALETAPAAGTFNETEWLTLPANAASLATYPDTTTWEAKEGCYMVGVLNHADLRPSFTQYRKGFVAVTSPDFAAPSLAVGVTNGALRCFDFDQFGAYFSGLGDDTVLSITVKYFLESFPSADDTIYMPVARPTTGYDPVIIEMYDRCMRELPVAVMVKENPLGEWFDTVLQGIESVAPMLSGIPIIGNIANAVKPIASGVRKAMGTKPSKKKAAAATGSIAK
jgi:hypothetical protein